MVDGQLTTITDLSASIGVALAPSAGATISKLTSNANTGKLVADITGSNKVVCLPDTA